MKVKFHHAKRFRSARVLLGYGGASYEEPSLTNTPVFVRLFIVVFIGFEGFSGYIVQIVLHA